MESSYARFLGGIDLVTSTLQRTGCGQVTQEQVQGSKGSLGLLQHSGHCHTAIPGLATTTRVAKLSEIRSSVALQTPHVRLLGTSCVDTAHMCCAW